MELSDTKNDGILGILNSTDPAAKVEIINMLNNINVDEKVAEKLCELLADEEKWVRYWAAEKLKSLQNKNIPAVLVTFISSKDIGLRNLAGDILLAKKSESVPALMDFIPKSDEDAQKISVDILGLIGDKDASAIIFNLLRTSKNQNIILSCIEALGNIRCEYAFEEIIKLYDNNEVFKPTAVEAIGKIGNDQALKFITSRYDNEDTLTQFSMIEALGGIGSEKTYFFFLNRLNETSGPLIWPLLYSIYQLKEKFNLDIPYDDKIKLAVLYTLREGEIKYKVAAAKIAVSLCDMDMLFETIQVMGIDPELDDKIKTNVFESAGIVLPKLIKLLKPSSPILKNVLNILEELVLIDQSKFTSYFSCLEMRNLADTLASCLAHPDEEIRRSAMELFFGADKENAMLFSDIMLDDPNTWNKLRLVELLESIKNEKSNESLKKLSNDNEVMIADRALFVLQSRNIAPITMGMNK